MYTPWYQRPGQNARPRPAPRKMGEIPDRLAEPDL